VKKGEKTKQAIIDTSKELFAQKGYCAVTMKDICDACHLSRGGLYRYFSGTKNIFIAILDEDMQTNQLALKQSVSQEVSAVAIFNAFLNQEKEAVFGANNGLYFAVHEFAFVEPDQRGYLEQRLKDARNILGNLFRYGQQRGEFKEFDVQIVSNHIIYFLDSIKTSASVLTVTDEMFEQQMQILKELII